MEKKQFLKITKDIFKKIGFYVKGNYCYKILDKDYLMGMTLDHNPYSKGYFIEYGGVYLLDEGTSPFRGIYDWEDRFLFTRKVNDDLKKYSLENLECDDDGLTECFEYGIRTPEELMKQLEINIEKKLMRIEDKKFILAYYRDNIDALITLPDEIIMKLLKKYEFDRDKINFLRKKWGYSKYDF